MTLWPSMLDFLEFGNRYTTILQNENLYFWKHKNNIENVFLTVLNGFFCTCGHSTKILPHLQDISWVRLYNFIGLFVKIKFITLQVIFCWNQFKQTLKEMPCLCLQDGTVNDKPIYRKYGNKNLYLAYADVSKNAYPTPWVMWGGPHKKPGDHIGNIKFGYKGTACPENYTVLNNIYIFVLVWFTCTVLGNLLFFWYCMWRKIWKPSEG